LRNSSGSLVILAAIRRVYAGCTPGAASTKIRRMVEPIIWNEVRIPLKGKIVRGLYSLSHGGRVTVKTSHGSKTAHRAGLKPGVVARILLRELATEGKA
jgi:hypothetical protein